MRITCKRNQLAPKTSVGALTGAKNQLLGTDKEFLSSRTLPLSKSCSEYLHWRHLTVMIGSPGDGKALKGWQTWAQPLGWPLSHQVCWVVSEMEWGYHS